MDAGAIITVSAAVVALTQICKWGFLKDKQGPLAVLILSLLGVAMWAWSKGDFQRASVFDYFAGFVAVALNAAGVFGFTRAAAGAVTSASPPPSGGAGGSSTV